VLRSAEVAEDSASGVLLPPYGFAWLAKEA